MSQPIVITSSYDVIPKRYWERIYQLVTNFADAYRYEVCNHCKQLISNHTWFLIDTDNDHVSDCSEAPL